MTPIEKIITAMPAGAFSTGTGQINRLAASARSSMALPVIKADWPSTARGSDLPWPNRCSRSAGLIACRTATKVTSDATASSSESTRLDSSATDPVSSQAPNFTVINNAATATEA